MEGRYSVIDYSSPLNSTPGLLFNVNGGYLEGIVRGYRNTLLTSSNYSNVNPPVILSLSSN